MSPLDLVICLFNQQESLVNNACRCNSPSFVQKKYEEFFYFLHSFLHHGMHMKFATTNNQHMQAIKMGKQTSQTSQPMQLLNLANKSFLDFQIV